MEKPTLSNLYLAFFLGLGFNLLIGYFSDRRFVEAEQTLILASLTGIISGLCAVFVFWFFSRDNKAALPFLFSLFAGFGVGARASDVMHGAELWYAATVLGVQILIMIASYRYFARKTRRTDVPPPEDHP